MADITKKEIEHIAQLAMLNLSDEEIDGYTNDIREILDYVEMINKIDTSDVDEKIENKTCNVFRDDIVGDCLQQCDVLKNAPSCEEGMFNVPKVVN